MIKIWTWIKVNIASILGISQAVIKALKEVLTAVVNLLSIFFPVIGSQKVVLTIRAVLETIDGWIEKLKPYLIPNV
jgi:phage-related protein